MSSKHGTFWHNRTPWGEAKRLLRYERDTKNGTVTIGLPRFAPPDHPDTEWNPRKPHGTAIPIGWVPAVLRAIRLEEAWPDWEDVDLEKDWRARQALATAMSHLRDLIGQTEDMARAISTSDDPLEMCEQIAQTQRTSRSHNPAYDIRTRWLDDWPPPPDQEDDQ